MSQIREMMDSLPTLEVEELEKVAKIIETLIVLKKELADVDQGRLVKLQQGKKQPISMMDSENRIFREFSGFTACSAFLKREYGIKNAQNKLRKAIETGEPINGFTFLLKKRI